MKLGAYSLISDEGADNYLISLFRLFYDIKVFDSYFVLSLSQTTFNRDIGIVGSIGIVSVRLAITNAENLNTIQIFLDASTHLYKRVCPSVGPSVRNAFF